MADAKRRIHNFNFDQMTMKSGTQTHVALVDAAANMTEVLVMKSATPETTVEADEVITAVSNTHSEEITSDITKSSDGEDNMSDVTITQEELDILKAAKAEKEAMVIKIADLEKSALRLADIEKAQADKELADNVDVVKGFNLFDEDKIEDVAKFLVENKCDASNLILESLEKARKAIKEFGEAEHGNDLEGEAIDVNKSVTEIGNSVMEILKSRKKEA